jgi:cyclin H
MARDIDCLTPAEELKLVVWYGLKTLELADHLKLPTDVKVGAKEDWTRADVQATAVQYLKRFYINNSPMTYDPKTILKTALFFATKSANHYMDLGKFCEQVQRTDPAEILATEFLLTQGLRFTFDARHASRPLEGAMMELQALDHGAQLFPGQQDSTRPADLRRRIPSMHGKAKATLKAEALLSDVYFHYTPSQIMLAALLLADEEVARWYLGLKVLDAVLRSRLAAAVASCAALLELARADANPSEADGGARLDECRALARKLKSCQNPDKIDLVALNRKVKRDGAGDGDDRADDVARKRKRERDEMARVGDELFGPSLRRSDGG